MEERPQALEKKTAGRGRDLFSRCDVRFTDTAVRTSTIGEALGVVGTPPFSAAAAGSLPETRTYLLLRCRH